MSEGPQLPDHDKARELADRIATLLREGRPDAARRIFSQGWRDAVPELPLRFSVRLQKLNRPAWAQIARQLTSADHEIPELSVSYDDAQKTAAVVLLSSAEVLGQVPRKHVRRLLGFGADRELFEVQLLEVAIDSASRVSAVTIEFKRPELRICSSCGARHAEDTVNCVDCRARRRRKGPEEDSYEPPPVDFHEAIEQMLIQGKDSEKG